MNKKQFNSKYAIDMNDRYKEEDIASLFGHGDEGGYSVFDNPLKQREPISTSEGEQHQETIDADQGTEIDSPAFSPPVTIGLNPEDPDRESIVVPRKRVPFRNLSPKAFWPINKKKQETAEESEEEPKYDVEEYRHDPDAWINKIRESVGRSRAMRILRPEAYAARKERKLSELQNIQNRHLMAASLAIIPETLRKSEAYQCRRCKGNGCAKCDGWGYNQDSATSLIDIKSSAAANNSVNDEHDRICLGPGCFENCARKQFIDEHVRIPHYAESNVPLKAADVKAKSGRNTVVDRKLRMTVVDDQWKPIAKGLSVLAPKDGSIGKYSVCHFMNFDTQHPDTNIGGGDTEDQTDNENVYNAGGGSRDKQAFAVVTNVNKNGTYDVIYSGRALPAIRAERRERLKGRNGKTEQFQDEESQGLSEIREDDKRFIGVRRQIRNLFTGVSGFMGERSPAKEGRYYKVLRNVPGHLLAPVDNIGSALICDSGMSALTRKKKEVQGWSTTPQGNGVRGNRNFTEEQLEQPQTVNVRTRIGHGFSTDELQRAFQTTSDEDTMATLNRLRDDARRDLGIERGNFDNDEDFEAFSSDYDFGHGLRDAVGPLRPISVESHPSPNDFIGQLPTEQPDAIEPPKKTFNSALSDEDTDRPSLDTSGFEMPMEPSSITKAIGNPKPTKDLFSAIQAEEPKKPAAESPSENILQDASDELGLKFNFDEPKGESE